MSCSDLGSGCAGLQMDACQGQVTAGSRYFSRTPYMGLSNLELVPEGP